MYFRVQGFGPKVCGSSLEKSVGVYEMTFSVQDFDFEVRVTDVGAQIIQPYKDGFIHKTEQ